MDIGVYVFTISESFISLSHNILSLIEIHYRSKDVGITLGCLSLCHFHQQYFSMSAPYSFQKLFIKPASPICELLCCTQIPGAYCPILALFALSSLRDSSD